jgi:predicted ATPase
LGESAELDALKHIIIERTQGNPFFIEEMVQALFDEGAVIRNGTVKIMRPLGQLRMPPTVQGILAARIDRLPATEKDLLQTLAVVGRQAPLAVIMQIVARPQIRRMLANLQTAEFIYEQAASGAAVAYEFKHALTQDVAYNSLLIERRRVLHGRVGETIESIYGGQLDDHVGELARHYSHSNDIAKAVGYLERAGQQALQRCAPTDATSNLASAIELLQKLPHNTDRVQRELPLQMTLGYALILLKGWAASEVEQAFTRALDICEHLGNPPEVFFALSGLQANYHVRGDYRRARDQAQELLGLAESTGDHTHLVLAHYVMGEALLHTGELKLAKEHQELMLSLYDEVRDHPLIFRIGVHARQAILSYAGWTLWLLGYPDQALAIGKETVVFARGLAHP